MNTTMTLGRRPRMLDLFFAGLFGRKKRVRNEDSGRPAEIWPVTEPHRRLAGRHGALSPSHYHYLTTRPL